jgi:predicted Zn-dependent protease
MLEVAQNQHQLAAVVAHEVAHVIARHSNERVSTNFVTQTGLQLAQVAAGGNSPARQELFGLLGVGAQFGVLLPFGRAQESEADLVGLDYMARAGFDPRESVRLWENMAKVGGAKPPEFLSTHPSGDRRMRDLNARMRDAMSLSVQARSSGRNPDCR